MRETKWREMTQNKVRDHPDFLVKKGNIGSDTEDISRQIQSSRGLCINLAL